MDLQPIHQQEATSSSTASTAPQDSLPTESKALRSSARVKAAKQKSKSKGKGKEREVNDIDQQPSASSSAPSTETTATTTATRSRATTGSAKQKRSREAATGKGKAKEISEELPSRSAKRIPSATTASLSINEPVKDPKGKKQAAPDLDDEDNVGPSFKRSRTTAYSLRSSTSSPQVLEMPKKTRQSTNKGKAAFMSKMAIAGPSRLEDEDVDTIWLNCIIQGEDVGFAVPVGPKDVVSDLKNKIKKECAVTFEGVDARHLELWKHKDFIDAKPADTLVERIRALGHDLSKFAVKLDSLETVFSIFPIQPRRDHIHIIVKGSHTRNTSRASPQTPEHPAKRRRLQEKEMLRTPPNTVQAASQVSPPRIEAKDIEPSMLLALKPFTQYITYLAQGKLDGYFKSIQPEDLVTDLEAGLPAEPMLLLHDLGNNIHEEMIKSLFVPNTVQLFGVSGSGKTRRTLEGLCHNWGFYITSQKREIGSLDFELAINLITSISGWDGDNDTRTPNRDRNASVANRAFAMLICARVFVLKHLLQNLPINTEVGAARKRWVLAQVIPPSLYHDEDIFTTIFKSLRGASEEDMLSLARTMLKDADMVKTERGAFFAVIDEAQVAAEYLSDSFRSFSGTDLRPALHAFYRFLQKTRIFRGIILAGTGLSMHKVKDVLSSQVAKYRGSQEPIIFVELGRFTGDQIHKDYIEKYSSLSADTSGKRLLDRILYWFSGRYRFTASLIEVLLAQPSSPHRILSAFVKSMTKFTITDAIDLEEEEPELIDTTFQKIKSYGNFSSLARLFEKGELIRCLFDALMRWRIGSETTSFPIEGYVHDLVALGVGHLEKAEPDSMLDPSKNYPVYLCEPLVVLSLSSSFNEHLLTQETWIIDAFRTARNASSRGFIFEEAVLLVLLQKFGGKSCALSDAFHCDQPWGSRNVTLVSLKRAVDDSMQCWPVSWTSGSSDRLGLKAALPKTVLTFLNNPDGKCFIFPDNHMGPDLLFFLQDVETKELILVGLQCKLVHQLDVSGWQEALRSVTPDFFYTINTKNRGRVQYAPLKYPGLLDDIVDAIDSMLGNADYKPVVDEVRMKLRSTTDVNKQLESRPSRQTPKYLRVIATQEARQQWKSESSGDVGVLRWELVEAYLGSTADAVMGTPSVA